MDIERFRVTVRARDFDRTCRFYGETLALPKVGSRDEGELVANEYQAGPGTIEVIGRAEGAPRRGDDDIFEYRGPDQKMEITLLVDSPQKAYDELIFRNQNIPGGMHELEGGAVIFQTHDPDGVRILFRAL
jgi:catechol 2,3-dioxygenase-like lactoylglutathione lyase family enzyme